MKIHITNLYNLKKEDPMVTKQHRFAQAGLQLGFREMGIFGYPVKTDTEAELSRRLDGIIAALEPEDLVFMQLPTGNGYIYERRLANKIKAYQNTKLVLILHDVQALEEEKEFCARYPDFFKMADVVVALSEKDERLLKKYGVSEILTGDSFSLEDMVSSPDIKPQLSAVAEKGYRSLCQSDFYIKKILMDAMEAVFAPQREMVRSAMQAPGDEIQIAFGLHDKTGEYSVWVGTAMQSILEHTECVVCFHILHDETLSMQNKRKLMQVAAGKGSRVCFHLLDPAVFADCSKRMKYYTIGALFRIMLPEVLPKLPKIIYLDADILVNRDIRELWDMDIDDGYFMAAPDEDVVKGVVVPVPVRKKEVDAKRYFNSGVIYMNLDRIRKKGNMRRAVLDYLDRTPESDLPDQDALNVIYGKGTRLLDPSWNCPMQQLYRSGEKKLEKRIYHYIGIRCLLYMFTEIDQLYYETVRRTAWGEEACRKILNLSLRRMLDRSEQLEKLMGQIADPGKKRIFYGEETQAMKNLYRILKPREGDYRVLAETPPKEANCILPCRNLSAVTEEGKDTFVILVLPQADQGSAIRRLEQIGLKNEKDFFVIPRLLPYLQGGYI